MGSLGILLLLDMFSDINAPGLKGKLKIFVLGLSLGHPVHSPKPSVQTQKPTDEHATSTSTSTVVLNKGSTHVLLDANAPLTTTPSGTKVNDRSTENVLKSVACGGMARVHACPKPGRCVSHSYLRTERILPIAK